MYEDIPSWTAKLDSPIETTMHSNVVSAETSNLLERRLTLNSPGTTRRVATLVVDAFAQRALSGVKEPDGKSLSL